MKKLAALLAATVAALALSAAPASAWTWGDLTNQSSGQQQTTISFGISDVRPEAEGNQEEGRYQVAVRSNSPAPIVLSTTTPAVCEVYSGHTLRLISSGYCTVVADQAATSKYTAGHASQTFRVY